MIQKTPKNEAQAVGWPVAMTRGRGAVCLAALVALAAGLRVWRMESLSLNHFDEGVLVSGAFGVWLHGLWHFPLAQPLQSPPLYPWMIAGAFGLTQTGSPLIALYLSATMGSVTVLLYWSLLRRLYGQRCATIAAALLAASDLHIAFSRMALTDVPLTFWFVAATYCLTRLMTSLGPVGANAGQNWPRCVVQKTPAMGWCLAAGFAAGAAWTTKYNGWMWLAIAATTWLIVAARGWLMKHWRRDVADEPVPCFTRPAILLAIGVMALVAVVCFAPWYLYVERTLEGGYRAVAANHQRYFASIDLWPSRAQRLWSSLTAFRHFGWIATLVGFSTALAWYGCRGYFAGHATGAKNHAERFAIWFAGLALLIAAVALGSDAVVTVLAAAAIVPALVWGGWAEVFFAVWAGSFLVMTPFYHPYTRLLVPALPAEMALAVWLIAQSVRRTQGGLLRSVSSAQRRANRLLLAVACSSVLVTAMLWRPFGWLPSRGAWQRWSTRQSYRALGEAVRASDLPADAVVLCQGPPAMPLYLDRQWAPLEFVPFPLWLSHVDATRDCYLAVDFWGMYAENHQLAREAIHQQIGCLKAVVIVPNDLNLVTLLDYMPAAQVAAHVSANWPVKHLIDVDGREAPLPADLHERHADIIVLYRIDRDCVEQTR